MEVSFTGALGNQMFCYAFGRSLSLALNAPLFFNLEDLDGCVYTMDKYDLDIRFVGPIGPKYEEHGLPFQREVFSAQTNSKFRGHWLTEKYMVESGTVDLIRKELARPKGEPNEETKRVADRIQASHHSAFIHVRHGDFLLPHKIPYHGLMTLEFYADGMRRIEEKFPGTSFFVFSDDIPWCRENFKGDNCAVVSCNSPLHSDKQGPWDIWLMSLCNNAIVANSTFSWWGAWLNPKQDRIVIAPKFWFTPSYSVDPRDIVPEIWTKI